MPRVTRSQIQYLGEGDPFPPVGQAQSRAVSSRCVADALKPSPVRELMQVRSARRPRSALTIDAARTLGFSDLADYSEHRSAQCVATYGERLFYAPFMY
jgi:hypothetical protein